MSSRPEGMVYRHYDKVAIRLLEQIIILRKLQLPIRDIEKLWVSSDLNEWVDAFVRKIRNIDEDISGVQELREDVKTFMAN